MDLVLHDVTDCLGPGAVDVFIAGEDEARAMESLVSTNPELLGAITLLPHA